MDKNRSWYRLDNAAKIFPAIRSKRRTGVFRVAVLLKEEVDEAALNRSIEQVLPRFPCFAVTMRHGLFWYYLEHCPGAPKAVKDTVYPCMHMRRSKEYPFMFRVLFYRKRIAVEFFHSLTDGTGAMTFLKALLAQYLYEMGVKIDPSKDILNIEEAASAEEMQDAFLRYTKKAPIRLAPEERSYTPMGTIEPPGIVHITTGEMSVAAVKALAKEAGVSITVYLTSVLILSLIKHQKKYNYRQHRPVKVAIPINLRNYFKSSTLRNFIIVENVGVNPNYGEYAFEEILQKVHNYLRLMMNEKDLLAKMTANVALERNMLMRVMPFFMKNIILTFGFQLFGDSRVSSVLSNLGPVYLPKEMQDRVQRFEFILEAVRIKPISCAMISFGDRLVFNFTRMLEEPDVEREFFRFLVKKGVHVKIESNDLQE